jgi:hypothetical protein
MSDGERIPPCSGCVRVEVGTEEDEEVGDPTDSNERAGAYRPHRRPVKWEHARFIL